MSSERQWDWVSRSELVVRIPLVLQLYKSRQVLLSIPHFWSLVTMRIVNVSLQFSKAATSRKLASQWDSEVVNLSIVNRPIGVIFEHTDVMSQFMQINIP
jgi:hypothetical protein